MMILLLVIVLSTCHVPPLPGGQEGSPHVELGTS